MDEKLYELHAQMCQVFTSPKRLKILNLLKDKELSVNEIMQLTGLEQANLSQHLRIMKDKGILQTRRDGAKIYYSLVNKKIIKAFEIIREILIEKLAQAEQISKKLK